MNGQTQCLVTHRVPTLVLIVVPIGSVIRIEKFERNWSPGHRVVTQRLNFFDPT